MRVLIAFDKFKDALGAPEACACAAERLRQLHPDWILDVCPLTDGGDGFAEVLTRAAGGQCQTIEVLGPREEPILATFGRVEAHRIPKRALELLSLPDNEIRHLAVVEMAQASGLARLSDAQRDPWHASSYGTGQLLHAAADAGAGAILLGIGGSATHDLGLGGLAALGLILHDANGDRLQPPVPATWERAAGFSGRIAPLPPIRIACDVTNPLIGPTGAAAVFARQKGLPASDLPRLEAVTGEMAERLCAHCSSPLSLRDEPGAGAAGGIGFGLAVAAGAQQLAGYALVSAWLGLEERIKAADLVITGEGCFDTSSLSGKGPGAIARQAMAERRKVHVFAGAVSVPSSPGLACHALTPLGMPLAEALGRTREFLRQRLDEVFSS